MGKTKLVRLYAHCLSDGYKGEPIVTEELFEMPDGVDPKEWFLSIVNDYIDENASRDEDGNVTYDSDVGSVPVNDFNWGDLVNEIPDEFMARYGVRVAKDIDCETLDVDHDECLWRGEADE
jgi:hypothetical protein